MIPLIAGNQIGRIFYGIQHPAFRKTRPLYAFVPEHHFSSNEFQKNRYLLSRWPSINCGANPFGIGSHVVPDPLRSVSPRSRCNVLAEFIRRLETVSIKNPYAAT